MTDDTPVSKVEGTNVTSDYLRGTIAEELAGDAPLFSSDTYELLKSIGTNCPFQNPPATPDTEVIGPRR